MCFLYHDYHYLTAYHAHGIDFTIPINFKSKLKQAPLDVVAYALTTAGNATAAQLQVPVAAALQRGAHMLSGYGNDQGQGQGHGVTEVAAASGGGSKAEPAARLMNTTNPSIARQLPAPLQQHLQQQQESDLAVPQQQQVPADTQQAGVLPTTPESAAVTVEAAAAAAATLAAAPNAAATPVTLEAPGPVKLPHSVETALANRRTPEAKRARAEKLVRQLNLRQQAVASGPGQQLRQGNYDLNQPQLPAPVGVNTPAANAAWYGSELAPAAMANAAAMAATAAMANAAATPATNVSKLVTPATKSPPESKHSPAGLVAATAANDEKPAKLAGLLRESDIISDPGQLGDYSLAKQQAPGLAGYEPTASQTGVYVPPAPSNGTAMGAAGDHAADAVAFVAAVPAVAVAQAALPGLPAGLRRTDPRWTIQYQAALAKQSTLKASEGVAVAQAFHSPPIAAAANSAGVTAGPDNSNQMPARWKETYMFEVPAAGHLPPNRHPWGQHQPAGVAAAAPWGPVPWGQQLQIYGSAPTAGPPAYGPPGPGYRFGSSMFSGTNNNVQQFWGREPEILVCYERIAPELVPPVWHYNKGQYEAMLASADPWAELEMQKSDILQLRKRGLVSVDFLEELGCQDKYGNIEYSREAVVHILPTHEVQQHGMSRRDRARISDSLVSNHSEFLIRAAASIPDKFDIKVLVERCAFLDLKIPVQGYQQVQRHSRYQGFPGLQTLPGSNKSKRAIRTDALWCSVIGTTIWRLRLQGFVIRTGALAAIQPLPTGPPLEVSQAQDRLRMQSELMQPHLFTANRYWTGCLANTGAHLPQQ